MQSSPKHTIRMGSQDKMLGMMQALFYDVRIEEIIESKETPKIFFISAIKFSPRNEFIKKFE